MVIFGTGVVTGGLLVRHSERIQFLPQQRVFNNSFQRPIQQQPPSTAGGSRVEFLRRIERELDLSPDQHERIDKILMASQERTKKIMEPVTPRMREELQRTKDEFREVLTPEQRPRYDDLLRQHQRPRDPRRQLPPRDRSPSTSTPAPADILQRNP